MAGQRRGAEISQQFECPVSSDWVHHSSKASESEVRRKARTFCRWRRATRDDEVLASPGVVVSPAPLRFPSADLSDQDAIIAS